jgi:uncharacterized protein (UPF0305 family)
MVKKILTEAGFVEGETFEETQFISPPDVTYAVFMDSFTRKGADRVNLLKVHTYTIEVYSEFPDPEAEARIEEILDKYGIEYDKDERFWIQSEQLYQTVYTFEFIEK